MADKTIKVLDENTLKKLVDQGDNTWAEAVAIASVRATVTATIPNGGSVTPTVDLAGACLVGFLTPAAGWTAAALNIEVSTDNSRWVTLGVYDSTGVQTASYPSLAADSAYSVDMHALLPYRYVRLRSGTAALPVAQGAPRDFTLIVRPLA